MGRIYLKGTVIPKGLDLTAPEPVDQRTIVQYKADLYFTNNAYPGLEVQVLESIDGQILREYKFLGGSVSDKHNWVEVTGSGTGSSTPDDRVYKFISYTFKRNIGKPGTPIGGSYESPIPTTNGWTDGVPQGTTPLWWSTALFYSDNSQPIVWAEPVLSEDTNSMDYEYCNNTDLVPSDYDIDGIPLHPLEATNERTYWHNKALPGDHWQASGYKIGGDYPLNYNWQIHAISGEKGATGITGPEGRQYVEAISFTRSNLDLSVAKVTGGKFSYPAPYKTFESSAEGAPLLNVVWSDGIPTGTAKVWMTKYTFNNVDNEYDIPGNTWITPGGVTDTSTTDFEFCYYASGTPSDPVDGDGLWSDNMNSGDNWMAERNISNGVFGPWGKTLFKGEQGEAGKGIEVEGRDLICNILDKVGEDKYVIWMASDTQADTTSCTTGSVNVPGVINDMYLNVGPGNGTDGSEWDNLGQLAGVDGLSFKQSFIFKRSVTKPATPSGGDFATPVPLNWNDSIPAGVDQLWVSSRFFSNPSSVLEDWREPVLEGDTRDKEYIYAAKQAGDTEPAPPVDASEIGLGQIWQDDASVSAYWMGIGNKVNGTIDYTSWVVNRIVGEQGEQGGTGATAFISNVFCRTNDSNIVNTTFRGGTYINPIPTPEQGFTFTDGIEGDTGDIYIMSRKFTEGATVSPSDPWPTPTLMVTSGTVEYQYSASINKPSMFPVEGSTAYSWYPQGSLPDANIRWIAIGNKQSGEWPTYWTIIQAVGEQGPDGVTPRTYIPSTMFVRCSDPDITLNSVSGKFLIGTDATGFEIEVNSSVVAFVNNIFYVFSDGIPNWESTGVNNTNKIYQINGVFNSVDNLNSPNFLDWGKPTLLADTAEVDYEYHAGNGSGYAGTKPTAPDVNSNWVNDPDLITDGFGAYWIAQRDLSTYPVSPWVVYQIKGETGEQGEQGGQGDIGPSGADVPNGSFIMTADFGQILQEGWSPTTGFTGKFELSTIPGVTGGIYTTISNSLPLARFNATQFPTLIGNNSSYTPLHSIWSFGIRAYWYSNTVQIMADFPSSETVITPYDINVSNYTGDYPQSIEVVNKNGSTNKLTITKGGATRLFSKDIEGVTYRGLFVNVKDVDDVLASGTPSSITYTPVESGGRILFRGAEDWVNTISTYNPGYSSGGVISGFTITHSEIGFFIATSRTTAGTNTSCYLFGDVRQSGCGEINRTA